MDGDGWLVFPLKQLNVQLDSHTATLQTNLSEAVYIIIIS